MGVSGTSRAVTSDTVRVRRQRGTSRIASLPFSAASSSAKRLIAAIPAPLAKASLTASQEGSSSERTRAQPKLPARGLERGAGRGSLVARDPRLGLELPGPQPSAREAQRPDEDDLVLDQRLALELGRGVEPAQHGELDAVRAHELHRLGGRRELEVELDRRMARVEMREQRRQEVGAGDVRGGERSSPGLGVGAAGERPPGVGEQRLGAQDVVGKHLARRRQRQRPATADDELLAELGLQRRHVLGDRGLADVQLLGRARERPLPRDRREGPQARLHLHELSLCRW